MPSQQTGKYPSVVSSEVQNSGRYPYPPDRRAMNPFLAATGYHIQFTTGDNRFDSIRVAYPYHPAYAAPTHMLM